MSYNLYMLYTRLYTFGYGIVVMFTLFPERVLPFRCSQDDGWQGETGRVHISRTHDRYDLHAVLLHYAIHGQVPCIIVGSMVCSVAGVGPLVPTVRWKPMVNGG